MADTYNEDLSVEADYQPEAAGAWLQDSAAADPELTDEVQPDSPQESTAQTKRVPSSVASNRALIRRTAVKAQELAVEPDDQLGLLAAVLGVSGTGLADLTTAVMTASGKDVRVLTDALELLNPDQLEAGITAASLGRHRLRQLWKLFGVLDVITGDPAASDAKAAIALVRAVNTGDNAQTVRGRLESVLSLLKK